MKDNVGILETPVLKNKGFSRIETLVVLLTAVGFIAAILPALSNAEGISKRSMCLQNLRQLAAGFVAYAGDYEYLPYNKLYHDRDDGYLNYTILDDDNSPTGGDGNGDGDYMDVEDFLNHGKLFAYRYLENGWAYFCPAQIRDPRYAHDTYFDGDQLRDANERYNILNRAGRWPMSGNSAKRVRSSYICRNYCPDVSTEPYKSSKGDKINWYGWKQEAKLRMTYGGDYAFLADRWTYSSMSLHENNKLYNVAYADGRVETVSDPKKWIRAFGSQPTVIPPDSNFRTGTWSVGWYLLDNNFDWYNATVEDCKKLPTW